MIPRKNGSNVRWGMAILTSAGIAISYFDRQTLPVAIKAIESTIAVTDGQYSWLGFAFLFAYALMYIGGGRLLDALGTRRGFMLIMVWWSLACASQGLAKSFTMLAVSRLLLGIGEGGGFPAATKAVAEWFPVGERSTAMGIINSGTALGGILAPPGIAYVLSISRWPWVFYSSGAIGLLWTTAWMWDYFPPEQHPRLSAAERASIAEVLNAPKVKAAPVPWGRLLPMPQVWGLVTAKFLTDAAWYFYLLWLPKYLYDARHFDTKEVGYFAWIPFAAAGLGCLVGGGFSSWLIGRGHSLNAARKVALGASAAVMPFVVFITHSPVQLAIVIFCLAYFGQQSWSTLIMTLPADIFPQRVVGTVAGLVGFGGAIGGAIFGLLIGWLLDHGYGYGPVFLISGSLHVAAFGVILLTVRVVQPIDSYKLEPTVAPR
jgi:ACS family hexuronate transporter-like MFS transporter